MSANLFKVGDVWHYRFQVAGARVQRSTRLKSRRAAEPLADREFSAALARANGGQPVQTLDQLVHAWVVVHRPEMYYSDNRELCGFAEILLRKQRGGGLGDIPLRFNAPTCSLHDWQGRAPTAPASKDRSSSRFDG